LTEWYSGDYYANPTGNDRWIVWIQEEADFDRSLPSPNARRDTDIRQAVFGWYDLQTGQVRTMKLDVLFDYHPSLSPPALGLYNDMALIQVGMDIGDVETHVLLVDLKHGTTRRLNEGYVFTRDYSLWVSNDRVTLWQLSQHSTSDHLLQIRTSVEAFSTKNARVYNPGVFVIPSRLSSPKRNNT